MYVIHKKMANTATVYDDCKFYQGSNLDRAETEIEDFVMNF